MSQPWNADRLVIEVFGEPIGLQLISLSSKPRICQSLPLYIIANSCLAVVFSRHPHFAAYKDRLVLLANIRSEDCCGDRQKQREILFSSGAVPPMSPLSNGTAKDPQLYCFCCGGGAPCCSDACPVARLLRLLPPESVSESPLRKSAEAAAEEHFFRIITKILQQLDSLAARLAESFGYDGGDLLLAALAHCTAGAKADGGLQSAPSLINQLFYRSGSIIDCVHHYLPENPNEGRVSRWHSLRWELVPEAVQAMRQLVQNNDPTGRRPDDPAQSVCGQAAAARVAQGEASVDYPRTEDSSSCQACLTRQVNRVCLPCSHLALCSACAGLADRLRCPRCGAGILATIAAFLT